MDWEISKVTFALLVNSAHLISICHNNVLMVSLVIQPDYHFVIHVPQATTVIT